MINYTKDYEPREKSWEQLLIQDKIYCDGEKALPDFQTSIINHEKPNEKNEGQTLKKKSRKNHPKSKPTAMAKIQKELS